MPCALPRAPVSDQTLLVRTALPGNALAACCLPMHRYLVTLNIYLREVKALLQSLTPKESTKKATVGRLLGKKKVERKERSSSGQMSTGSGFFG